MTTNTYECSICLAINSAVRLQCKACGTIPAHYSAIHKPAKQFAGSTGEAYISVVLAKGYDRPEWHKTSRSTYRTVPADYYADITLQTLPRYKTKAWKGLTSFQAFSAFTLSRILYRPCITSGCWLPSYAYLYRILSLARSALQVHRIPLFRYPMHSE